ncbi:hypothetical protein [Rhizobium laguerreae]|uniref:hypothetical protein n=1 Tax=Rhizobium laguerreae TaxID=1076926 RepID=UPI00103E37D9|nr:hypothetical protein [Rhizobium laguerreae]TBY07621.1 hypothetical protein E0J21_15770 [Rhizobium laguerreae]
MLTILVAILSLAAIIVPVAAEATETGTEAVSFMLSGVEAGETTEAPNGIFRFQNIGNADSVGFTASGLTDDGTLTHSYKFDFVKMDECTYEANVTAYFDPEGGPLSTPAKAQLVLDFSKARDIEFDQRWKNMLVVKGMRMSCQSDAAGLCQHFVKQDAPFVWQYTGEHERAAKALDYFKKNFCEGGAF